MRGVWEGCGRGVGGVWEGCERGVGGVREGCGRGVGGVLTPTCCSLGLSELL